MKRISVTMTSMGMQETWDAGNNNHINFMSLFPMNYPVKPDEQLVKCEPVPTWVRLLIMLHWEEEVWRASMGYKSVSPFQNEDGSLNMDTLMLGIPKDYVWRDPRHPKPKSVSIFDRIFPLENKQL